MKNRHNIKLIISFVLFSIGILLSSISINQYQIKINSKAAEIEDISLAPYCTNGYYNIPGEPENCSRAPGCGGYDYDELNTTEKMPNPQACTTNPHACGGKPPLCCYEMARTGDFTKCIGYWERLWCPQLLCQQAESRGASNAQCGGSCQCGHAFGSYCGNNVQIVPLSQRLGITGQPTSTPTTQPTTTPTTVPSGIHTPTPTGLTPSNSPTPTTPLTPIPSNTPSFTPTLTYTPTPTNTLTPTSTHTPTPTVTYTPTPTDTPIPTETPTPTLTFTPAPTSTPQPTFTPQPTYTPYPTNTPGQNLTVNDQPPGITPWLVMLVPIGLVLIGLLL